MARRRRPESDVGERMAIPGRLELPTYGLGNRRSIRLSYGTANLRGKAGAGTLHSKARLVSPALWSGPLGRAEASRFRGPKLARTAVTKFGRRARLRRRREQVTTSAHAGNGLDVSAYRCVGVAARNRQNCRVHHSPLRPVATQHELPFQRAEREYVSEERLLSSLSHGTAPHAPAELLRNA